MLIFFGLGNPGEKYFKTKHNIGKLVLLNLSKKYELEFGQKHNFSFSKTQIQDQEIYFLHTNVFMNVSGESLVSFCKYFKLPSNQSDFRLIILQDDSDQIIGKSKLSMAGGSAGHHGINSIYKNILSLNLPMENVWRLKIGIRPKDNRQKSETFVLSQINQEELEFTDKLSKICYENMPKFLNYNLNKLQNSLNI